MKNILVTGATGFLGQHLVHYLASKKTNVTILLRNNSSVDRSFLSSVKYLYIDDLADLPNRFDCILHLATCYGRDGEKKEEVFDTNLRFGIEILEMALINQIKYFINFDTSLPDHINDYSSSKASFRSCAKNYASNELKILNLRIESIYGPNKNGTDFSNMIIRSCLSNKENLDLSNCQQIRDFIYYKDLINCVKFLMDNHETFDEYTTLQVGSGKGVSLKYFAELFKEISNSSTNFLFGAVPYKENEVMRSVANIETLNNMGWFPETTLQEGFKEIISVAVNGRFN